LLRRQTAPLLFSQAGARQEYETLLDALCPRSLSFGKNLPPSWPPVLFSFFTLRALPLQFCEPSRVAQHMVPQFKKNLSLKVQPLKDSRRLPAGVTPPVPPLAKGTWTTFLPSQQSSPTLTVFNEKKVTSKSGPNFPPQTSLQKTGPFRSLGRLFVDWPPFFPGNWQSAKRSDSL